MSGPDADRALSLIDRRSRHAAPGIARRCRDGGRRGHGGVASRASAVRNSISSGVIRDDRRRSDRHQFSARRAVIADAIKRLVEGKDLDRQQMQTVFAEMMDGKASDVQKSALLIALRMKG